jgi:phthalate 4,5-cis-dihydrodiol dehydrogenase
MDGNEPSGRSAVEVNRKMRLGLAGLGVGSTLFLPGVEEHPHTTITAAADTRSSARAAFVERYGGSAYATVAELCADPNVDIVWVTTPNQFHAEHCILAANNGKHVICTKPMALTIEECAAMCDAAERNGVQLLCGQTFSMFPDIAAMRDVVQSGELGKLIAVNSWLYTDWLLKPRAAEELDETLGGGVIYRHGPHLIDTVRLIGGGTVRSVRASVGRWMPERPCPGNFSAFLEFEDGTPATIAYNGYGYFDTSELTWGIGNRMYSDAERVNVRRSLRNGSAKNDEAKEGMRFGASADDPTSRGSGSHNPAPFGTRAHVGWFGITVASCERGDVRQSPTGIFVYGDDGRREISVREGRIGTMEMEEMYGYLNAGKPITHDGRWALATLEVGLAIAESGRTRREVMLSQQSLAAR